MEVIPVHWLHLICMQTHGTLLLRPGSHGRFKNETSSSGLDASRRGGIPAPGVRSSGMDPGSPSALSGCSARMLEQASPSPRLRRMWTDPQLRSHRGRRALGRGPVESAGACPLPLSMYDGAVRSCGDALSAIVAMEKDRGGCHGRDDGLGGRRCRGLLFRLTSPGSRCPDSSAHDLCDADPESVVTVQVAS
jgi:hypothetical protein